MLDKKLIRRIIHCGLLIIIIIFIITGFGIARYQIIESLTLGLISKPVSFQVHFYLIFPLIVFLYLHILLTWKKNKKSD
jgi:thiosulfate reductase cytochrome b subunit